MNVKMSGFSSFAFVEAAYTDWMNSNALSKWMNAINRWIIGTEFHKRDSFFRHKYIFFSVQKKNEPFVRWHSLSIPICLMKCWNFLCRIFTRPCQATQNRRRLHLFIYSITFFMQSLTMNHWIRCWCWKIDALAHELPIAMHKSWHSISFSKC